MFYRITKILDNETSALICVVHNCGFQVNADQGFSQLWIDFQCGPNELRGHLCSLLGDGFRLTLHYFFFLSLCKNHVRYDSWIIPVHCRWLSPPPPQFCPFFQGSALSQNSLIFRLASWGRSCDSQLNQLASIPAVRWPGQWDRDQIDVDRGGGNKGTGITYDSKAVVQLHSGSTFASLSPVLWKTVDLHCCERWLQFRQWDLCLMHSKFLQLHSFTVQADLRNTFYSTSLLCFQCECVSVCVCCGDSSVMISSPGCDTWLKPAWQQVIHSLIQHFVLWWLSTILFWRHRRRTTQMRTHTMFVPLYFWYIPSFLFLAYLTATVHINTLVHVNKPELAEGYFTSGASAGPKKKYNDKFQWKTLLSYKNDNSRRFGQLIIKVTNHTKMIHKSLIICADRQLNYLTRHPRIFNGILYPKI